MVEDMLESCEGWVRRGCWGSGSGSEIKGRHWLGLVERSMVAPKVMGVVFSFAGADIVTGIGIDPNRQSCMCVRVRRGGLKRRG